MSAAQNVKRAAWLTVGAMSGILSASAAISTNPYQAIVAQNAFRLRAVVPAPVIPVAPPVLPALNVVVTGITDSIGRKVALVEITTPGKAPLKPIMAEGDSAGVVELLHIDVQRSLVKMRIRGLETNFSLMAAAPKPGTVLPAFPPPVTPLVRR